MATAVRFERLCNPTCNHETSNAFMSPKCFSIFTRRLFIDLIILWLLIIYIRNLLCTARLQRVTNTTQMAKVSRYPVRHKLTNSVAGCKCFHHVSTTGCIHTRGLNRWLHISARDRSTTTRGGHAATTKKKSRIDILHIRFATTEAAALYSQCVCSHCSSSHSSQVRSTVVRKRLDKSKKQSPDRSLSGTNRLCSAS